MRMGDYVEMRKATRTEEDMPEGVIGYDIDKMVRKNSVDACIAYSEANRMDGNLPDHTLVSSV